MGLSGADPDAIAKEATELVGIVSVAASVHYSAAIPNFQILEHSHRAHEIKARVATRYPAPVNGEFVLDDTPGLGVEIDEAAGERF